MNAPRNIDSASVYTILDGSKQPNDSYLFIDIEGQCHEFPLTQLQLDEAQELAPGWTIHGLRNRIIIRGPEGVLEDSYHFGRKVRTHTTKQAIAQLKYRVGALALFTIAVAVGRQCRDEETEPVQKAYVPAEHEASPY